MEGEGWVSGGRGVGEWRARGGWLGAAGEWRVRGG